MRVTLFAIQKEVIGERIPIETFDSDRSTVINSLPLSFSVILTMERLLLALVDSLGARKVRKVTPVTGQRKAQKSRRRPSPIKLTIIESGWWTEPWSGGWLVSQRMVVLWCCCCCCRCPVPRFGPCRPAIAGTSRRNNADCRPSINQREIRESPESAAAVAYHFLLQPQLPWRRPSWSACCR